jgi:hypothetical protein
MKNRQLRALAERPSAEYFDFEASDLVFFRQFGGGNIGQIYPIRHSRPMLRRAM